MGIFRFFPWFRDKFGNHIKSISPGKTLDGHIDNLLIDLNGLFHQSTQKIYEYGSFKPPKRLLSSHKKNKSVNGLKLQIRVFEDICKNIEELINITNPSKRIILCVDGSAPIAKQCQQRKRRYKSALEKTDDELIKFDQNALTPGTKFMDFLNKYLDWFIRKKITEDEKLKNIDIVFSSEKTPGEGEWKLFQYIRNFGITTDSFCIHGMDADLIMLALGTHLPNIYILREDVFNNNNAFYYINVSKCEQELVDYLSWNNGTNNFNPHNSIDDFIFICFMVGNDFLPHVPSLEIIEGGIDEMIDIYKTSCKTYGHLTHHNIDNTIEINIKSLHIFLSTIGLKEKSLLEDKLLNKDKYFHDIILENNSKYNDGKYNLHIKSYKEQYYKINLPEINTTLLGPYGTNNLSSICHEYIEGMQWVLSYYLSSKMPSWTYCFQHHYAPFASDLANHLLSYTKINYEPTSALTPFQQLLSVLPPKSASLLPFPLSNLLTNPDSLIKKYCPDDFKIDLSGKSKEYECVVLLPFMDVNIMNNEYNKLIHKIDPREKNRNIFRNSHIYKYSDNTLFNFKSFYGNIENCKTSVEIIKL
jgi:5'-3' exonuclease